MRTTVLLLLCSWALSLFAQTHDNSLSPYFVVRDSSAEGLQMPLQHTSASVNISGIVADVTIQQVYQNTGSRPIEAEYIFPASTRAAVYAMNMQIGERIIEAKIKEKATARQMYETAQAQGKTASLLEQYRPNIFQMQVANIMPGDSIVIRLQYTELLLPKEGVYEFVYPTVVGPRYTGPDGNIRSLASPVPQPAKSGIPYSQAGSLPTYSFGFKAIIQAGMPIDSITSPSHELLTEALENGSQRIQLGESEQQGGNRDLVLQYRLRGEDIQAGLMTYREKGEKFFLSLVQPPKRAQAGTHVPREYVFVVDVSGSMSGTPLNNCKALMAEVFKQMDSRDRLNVLMFSGGSSVWSPKGSRPATSKNLKEVQDFLDSRGAGGGTQLVNALQTALSLPQDEYMPRTFLVCTDGYISVEQQAFDLIRQKRGEHTVFTIGIGSSVNRHLIEGIARAGNGESFVLLNRGQAEEVARQFQTYVQHPILTEIVGQFGEMEVYDLEPLNIPNLYASMPIAIVGKYTGKVEGELLISGNNAAGPQQIRMDLAAAQPLETNRGLRYLWARKKLERLGDLPASDTSKAAQITQMGLQYNLLTDYTSFVAIQHKRRNKEQADSTVKQTLPLPEGVSDDAVGAIGYSSTAGSKDEAGEYIQIRGARSGGTVYYIDGMKMRTSSGLQLEEVVVTSLGMSRSSQVLGYSVQNIQQTDHGLQTIPGGLQLAGRVPGLYSQHSSGFSQANPQLTIRAGSSLIGGNQALVVVDGLPLLPNHPWPHMNALSLNPWLGLSGSEISTISVWKDPGANVSYGGLGSNGALTIYSKTPRAGDQGWRFQSRAGAQWLSRPWEQDSLAQLGWLQSQEVRYHQWKRKGWFTTHTSFNGEQGPVQGAGFRQIQSHFKGQRNLWQKGSIGTTLNGNLSQANEGSWASGGEHRYRLLRGTVYANWNFLPYLTWTSRLGGEFRQGNWQTQSPISLQQEFEQQGWSHQHKLKFAKHFQDHFVQVEGGFFQQRYAWEQLVQQDSQVAQSGQVQQQHHAFFIGKFSYDQRYVLQLSQTWQQGGIAGQNTRWQWLPTIAARWNLSEETFADVFDHFDEWSLKASWGRNAHLPQWFLHPMPLSGFLGRNSTIQALNWEVPEGLSAWESIDHLNVGLSTRVWRGKIFANVEAFQKDGRNLWLPVPIQAGASWKQEIHVLPHLRTRGIESRFDISLGKYNGFQADLGLNISWQQQHILSLPQGPLTLGATPWNQPFWDIQAGKLSPSVVPTWYGGMPISLEYRGFTCAILFNGESGRSILRLPAAHSPESPILPEMIETIHALRFQQLQFGYEFPHAKLSGSFLDRLRLNVQGQNLALWSNYSGFDPEVNLLGQHPLWMPGIDQGAFPRPTGVSLGVELFW